MKNMILFFSGSLNQSKLMYQISQHFNEYECHFAIYNKYSSKDYFVKKGFLNHALLRDRLKGLATDYLLSRKQILVADPHLKNYDMVFTCQDLVLNNLRNAPKIILVQEGIIEPESALYHMVKMNIMPGQFFYPTLTQLSVNYDLFFVASEGYREMFSSKGFDNSKIRVTGIPNLDNLRQHISKDFQHQNYILALTSDRRDSLQYENRKIFIHKALSIAGGRQVIFKLHPHENVERGKKMIAKYAPGAIVYVNVDINPLVANCDELVTINSPAIYTGLALGKTVHAELSMDLMRRLIPIQNHGTSASEIAGLSKSLISRDIDFSLIDVIRDYQYA